MTRDPHLLLSALQRDRVALELSTLDVCFLSALFLRAEQDGLASFEEELMLDLFDQICALVEPGAEPSRKRATHTIQRLRSQRMLARVDATGIISAGEYALTSLATVLVRSFLDEEQLTRESLALLTGAVISSLGQIRAAAARAGDAEAWRAGVIAPLRVTIGDLVAGIERRQRGLDAQQEDVQRRISLLLQADWFGAVEQCQDLLDATAGTLQELNEVLLRDSSQIQALLQEIQQAAADAGAHGAEEAALHVGGQVDRMAVWGASRQQAWSRYYQYVHRFLRDVVRLDPDRALSQRLLDQLRGWTSRPFALNVSSESSIRVLRPLSARGERAAVARPHADRERDPAPVAAEEPGRDLAALVGDALAGGASTLAEVTRHVLAQLDPHEHYRAAGRTVAVVANETTPRVARDRPWVGVSRVVEIEDWALTPAGDDERA